MDRIVAISRQARLACIALALLSLSGCYVLQAARGQLGVMSKSRPIPAVLADPKTDAPTRGRLELAQQARDFAIRDLGLPDGRSYRKYADLGRPYAVWNVVATPEFSVAPRRWCFPVAGCVAYRGYFEERRARDLALKLSMRGDDVAVGGVPTHSTLGHLPDPLFSTMFGWRESRFVGTIFHELAHERLYFEGDSEFNEAFATVVEDEGVRRWLTARGQAAELEVYQRAAGREAEFAALLRTTRSRLARLYASGQPVETLRIEKQREFGRLKFEYAQLRARWGGYAGYDGWFARSLNNAHLASIATYMDCVPGLRRMLDDAGSLPAFYEHAAALRTLPAGQRHTDLCGK